MSSFVPPYFGKIGQSVKDLFKKKYEYDHTVKTINKAKNGWTLESGAKSADNVKGFIKGKYADPAWGESEVEVNTCAKSENKATLKLKKLADGVTVTLGSTCKDGSSDLSADIQYEQEYFAEQTVLKTDIFNKHTLDLSATVGFDGLAVGGQVKLDLSKGADVTDTNVGAQYTNSDFTLSLYTEKNCDLINGGYFQKINRDTQVGALIKYDTTGKSARSVTIGTEHQLDFDTTIKASAELPTGVVSTAIEHRLSNPKLQFGVAAQFKALERPLVASKFGLSLTFGDF